uniref:Uncharacterized protein n=1 Tax=Panagrolaimus superbus TaxID=310955 RepID=A0A914Z3Y5_9BILA
MTKFITFGQLYSLNETTNRKTDSESQLFLSLQNSVNLSLTDTSTQTQVEAINGRKAQINANTWDVQIARKLTLSSNVLQNFARELTITSVSNKYNVAIILDGAQVGLLYGNVRLDIQSDYRKLTLTTETHKVELQTFKSPFDLSLTDEELLIRAPDENTALQIKPNSSDISINVNQLSQMAVDRFGGGTLTLQSGSNGTQAEALQLDSQELSLHLFSSNDSDTAAIQSTSNHSKLVLQTNLTKASLTAGHHFIQILGGAPHLLLYTGNITLDVASNTQGISAVKLLPDFLPPEDQFQNIGPYGSETDPNLTGTNNNPGGPINGNGSNGNNGQTNNNNNGGTETPVTAVTVKGNQGIPNLGGQGTTVPTSNQGTGQSDGDGTQTNPGFVIVTPTSPIGPGMNTPPPSSNQNNGANINSSIDNPISIEPSFPRPPNTSDNFIIGQFGSEVPPTVPTIEGYPIFATITNIVLPENSTFPDDFPVPPITITTANTTEIFLISTSTPLRMLRDDSSAVAAAAAAASSKGLMQVKLRVQRDTINDDEDDDIRADLEKNLSELVESALLNITEENSNNTRKKRMLNEVDVKVFDLIRNDAEPEAVVVKFYVDKPDYFRDLPFLATKLNAFGHQMLSEKLKYKVISPVKVQHNLNLGFTLFAIVSALIIMIILIVITIQCTSQQKNMVKIFKEKKG